MGDRGRRQGESGGEQRDRKAPIIDFNQYLDKRVRIKFAGGREVSGTLKGADQLLNFVIDDAVEYLRDPTDSNKDGGTRQLGLVVCRGTALALLAPESGLVELQENPYATA